MTSGLDLTFAFIEQVWGKEMADRITGMAEYERHSQTYDPFSAMFNVTPTNTEWLSQPTATGA